MCPRDHEQYTIPLHYMAYNGAVIYAPCNGCDNLCGARECVECVQRINDLILCPRSEPVKSLI